MKIRRWRQERPPPLLPPRVRYSRRGCIQRLPLPPVLDPWRASSIFSADPPHNRRDARAEKAARPSHARATSRRVVPSARTVPLVTSRSTSETRLLNGELESVSSWDLQSSTDEDNGSEAATPRTTSAGRPCVSGMHAVQRSLAALRLANLQHTARLRHRCACPTPSPQRAAGEATHTSTALSSSHLRHGCRASTVLSGPRQSCGLSVSVDRAQRGVSLPGPPKVCVQTLQGAQTKLRAQLTLSSPTAMHALSQESVTIDLCANDDAPLLDGAQVGLQPR